MEKRDLEALLFLSKEPLNLNDISKTLNEDINVVVRWILELQKDYHERGILIRQVAGGFEMTTNPLCAEVVEKIIPKVYTKELSKAQFETLSVIAYNQPVSIGTIAKYRNVKKPDEAVNRLLEKKFITWSEKGYVTTDSFLKFFGINDLKELPSIENLERKNEKNK